MDAEGAWPATIRRILGTQIIKRLLNAIIDCKMTTPTSSASFGGWGQRIGAGLSKVEDENRPQLNSATTFNNLITVNKGLG